MKLKNIDPPYWASAQAPDYGDLTDEEKASAAEARASLLEKINECIEEYVSEFDNVDNSTAEDPFENYPNLFEMTGDYYISDERYEKDDDIIGVNVCLELLQRPDAPSAKGENGDYHGVEILAYIHLPLGSVEVDGVVSSWGS